MCYRTVRHARQHLRYVRRGGGLAVRGRHARTVRVILDHVVQGLGHCARGLHLEHVARRPVLLVELEPDQRRAPLGYIWPGKLHVWPPSSHRLCVAIYSNQQYT